MSIVNILYNANTRGENAWHIILPSEQNTAKFLAFKAFALLKNSYICTLGIFFSIFITGIRL